MAQYFTSDFADFPASWTERYNAPASGTFNVASGDLAFPQGRSGDWCARTWDSIDGDANRATVEVLFLAKTHVDLTSGFAYLVALRGSGADESATMFTLGINTSQARIYTCYAVDNPTTVATASHGITVTSGTTELWVRYQVSGTGTKTVKLKVWTGAVGDEPGTWLINTTTATGPDAAGWVGLATFGVSTVNQWTIRQFGVGTNGDSAPAATPASGPTISAQPTAQTANEGATATFTVSATGTGTLHYQWKRQPPAGGAFSNVGTDSSSYTTGTLDCATDHTADFYVTVTDDNGPTDSSTVGLTVRAVTTTSRPAADVTTAGWTASTGVAFYALIDETPYSLTDYIDSPTLTGTPDWITMALDYPRATGDHIIPVWASVPGGAGTLKVRLENDSATVVGSATDQAVTGTATRYDLPITTSGPATRVSYAFVT